MSEQMRSSQAVLVSGGPVFGPEPFECEYGPIRSEIFDYIEANTDQAELANGTIGQSFEW